MTMLTSRAGRRRLVFTVAAAVVLIPALAACSVIPTACSAVGWINSVELTVSNAPDGMTVIACAGEDCEPQPPAVGPTIDPSAVTAMPIDGGAWQLDVGMSEPEYITVTVLDATGAAVATQQFQTDWKRVGGSEQCGGPASTSDLTLAV